MGRLNHLYRLLSIAAVSLLASSTALAAQCEIQRFPPMPVTMKRMQPTVSALINGQQAHFIVDSGAGWSMMSPAAATQYNIPEQITNGMYVWGAKGATDVDIGTVQTFTFLGVPIHGVQFLVGGNDFGAGDAGLLGLNILHIADVEFDFADGVMRFVETRHCGDLPLAYWAGNQPVGMVELQNTNRRGHHLIGFATVNGKRIRVMFDSGAGRSTLTLAAAKRLGIGPGTPGVRPVGSTFGVGPDWMKTWIAPVAEFEIGGEKIEHTQLLVSDMRLPWGDVDMLLGADFFLSHHIYVAYGQDRLYFTYNGGPVFDLGQKYWIKRGAAAPVLAGEDTAAPAKFGSTGPAAKAGGAPAAASGAAGHGGASTGSLDADELARQGMAFASEGQYDKALADLDRACELAPTDPDYRYQRGGVYRSDHQPAQALADFNAAIRMRQNFFEAHLARAALLINWSKAPPGSDIQARADINIVALLAPDSSELHLEVARLYSGTSQYANAIRQIDQWLYYHDGDAMQPVAWNLRCWVRAEADTDLDKALKDCDRAHDALPKSASILDSRGLVYLRLGRLDQSIADYDAALAINPRIPDSLYGRGLAELRQGKAAAGHADLAAAAHLYPGVSAQFARMKLTP